MPEFLVVLEETYTRKTHATVKAPDYLAAVEAAKDVVTEDAELGRDPYSEFGEYGLQESAPMRVLSVVELGHEDYLNLVLREATEDA